MSQFHPSQHGGDSDAQMWQQQMLYKQLQEFQRQQQQQQRLDYGARMQNSFGQFHAPAKPTPADQFPTMMNEMRMNEPSSYAWSNNIAVGGPRLGSNSQMFNTGNAQWEQLGVSPATSNFVNGSVYSNSQNLIRPMGLLPNKVDQSFYSFPAGMNKGSGNQYSQFPGFPVNSHNASHNAMSRAGSDQTDKATMFSSPVNSFQSEHGLREQGMPNTLQNFHENGSLLSDTTTQIQGGNMKADSPVLGNHLQLAFDVQDFHGRTNQVEFQSAPHVGPTSSIASLDPTEEKILYGNDEDSNWGDLLREGNSSGGADPGNSLGNDNSNGAVQFLQGSWSALMQEALQSTSSANGLQEEMSGVNFQNTNLQFANNSTLPGLEQRQLVALNNINLRSASPNAQPSPSRDGALGTMNNSKFTSFKHATESPYDQQEKLSHESPVAVTSYQPTTEANDRYFQQSLKQSHSDEYGPQEQVHLSNGIWAQQKPGLPKGNSKSTGAHFMPQNAHGLGVSQQNTFNHNFNRESSNNQNNWNCRNPHGQDANNTPNISNSDRSLWKSGVNTDSVHRLQQLKPNVTTVQVPNECYGGKDVGMMSSSMPMASQDRHQMVVCQSSENFGINHTLGQRFSEPSESQGNDATSTEGHISNNGQHLSSTFSARRNSFAGMDAQYLGQSGQKTMGSYAMHNHLSGTSGISAAHLPANSVSNTEFMSQSTRPPNNQEHLLGGHCHVAGNMASANEKIALAEEQLKSQHAIANNYSSESPFGGSDATLSLNPNRAVQTSQHMLQQFLHKVDNSSNYAVVAGNMPNKSVDSATAHQQLNQPSLQGFGLKLAPPSQRPPTAGHLWTSPTSVDSKQSDYSVPEEDQRQLPSTPGQSLPSGYPSRSSPFYSSVTDNTGLPSGCLPQISTGQQYPVVESKSASVNSLSQQPQQASSATMFKNVWTNISAQRLAGVQHNKITPNILQSMMFPNIVGDSTLWGSPSPKDDYQRLKAEIPSDAATTTPNSENREVKRVVDNDAKSTSSEVPNVDQMGDILSGKIESLQRHSLDGNLMQQGIMNQRQGENMAANFLPMSSSFDKACSVSGIGLHGIPTPSNAQQQKYSLLHQMRAMEPVDTDPSNTSGKRLKTTEMSSDASQVDWSAGQRVPANNSVRSCPENMEVSRVPSTFPSDVKMLSFAPRNSEERTPTMPSQLHSRELSSHDMATARTDVQNQVSSLGTSSAENLTERSDGLRINPQMAPWFQQHGSYRNGQNLAMYNAKKAATPYNLPKVSLNMDSSSPVEHGLDCSNSVAHGHSSLKASASSVVRRPKKRKFKAPVLVSWSRIVEGHQKLTNMSSPDMYWAQAANRLMEKVEDEVDILGDAPIFYLPRKRLILTSRLIQQLLPAIPASVLKAQAVSVYESATYTVAKLTIGDACSMASSSSGGTGALINSGNKSSEQIKITEKMEDKFLKAVEFFVGRLKKMENDFVSLNKRASMLDVQLDCQDLERVSIVNRLGRFHGRNHHAVGVEGSSTSELASRRIFPDRHVMSFTVPGNLPEGVSCLSL